MVRALITKMPLKVNLLRLGRSSFQFYADALSSLIQLPSTAINEREPTLKIGRGDDHNVGDLVANCVIQMLTCCGFDPNLISGNISATNIEH